jgi:ABC-type dipeptide/oligopeptide/nickel transport system ATPase subunit
MTTPTVLNAQDVVKTYGKGAAAFKALRGVSLEIKQ